MYSKLKKNALLVFFVTLIISLVSCSQHVENEQLEQTKPEQIILSSNVSTVTETTNSIELDVSFLHFLTEPTNVDVYEEYSENPIEENISVNNNKITVNISNLAIGKYKIYVKSGNVSSNSISITKEGHKYISIRLGKACNSKEDISSYTSSDYLQNDSIENKDAGVAKGYYYGLQLVAINFSSGTFPKLSVEGNNSSEITISEFVNASDYGSFYPLYIATNETAETITIVATYAYDETIKGTLNLELYNKFNRDAFTSETSFTDKTFLTKNDILYIRDTISANKTIDYNLDFTNCRFEFDTIPYCAFSKINPYRSYNWDWIIKHDGSPDYTLETDGALINLKSVILPNNIKEIDSNAFAYCYNMKLDKLPDSVKTICHDAFLYCKSITVKKIPDTVTRLESDAFSRCNGITSIELPNNLEYFDVSTFDDCDNILKIEIPSTVKKVGTGYGTTNFTFVVDNSNNYFKAIDGILYSKDGKTLYRVPCSKVGFSYSIPTSVSKIAKNALGRLSNLTTLYIPSSVTEMEHNAIVNCKNLNTINIDFSEKPQNWDDEWIWNTNDIVINYIGTSSDNNNDETDSDNGLTGTYTIKDNTSGQLKFSDGILEFIYTGITRNTYSYVISDSILTVTWDESQGPFVGQFDIEKTDTGYILKQKDDIALSWVGLWTHAGSTEKVEIYQ